MGLYDSSDSVDKYIEMCSDYDGSNLYQALQENLKDGSSLLELGSGPGLDMSFLSEHYHVTGSDFSDEFLIRCRKKFPEIPFIKIDASKIALKEKFDCIYSNKVLHHLTENQLTTSLTQQAKTLTEEGIIAHSFWIGEENQEIDGMLFTYYRTQDLLALVSKNYEVLTTLRYQEFEENDSLFVIAKVRK